MRKQDPSRKRLKGSLVLAAGSFLAFLVAGPFLSSPAAAACGCRCYPGVCPGDIVYDPIESAWEAIRSSTLVAKMGEIYEEYGGVATEVYNLYDTWVKGFMESMGAEADSRTALTTTKLMNAELSTKTTDAEVNAGIEAANTAEHLKSTYENPPETGADQALCNMLMTRMAVPVMQQFADMVSSFLAKGIDAVYRGPADVGDGPQHAADHMIVVCRDKMGNNAEKFPEQCRAINEVPGATRSDMGADADSVMSMRRVYTLPKSQNEATNTAHTSTDATHLYPDAEDETQQRFLLAAQYCYTLAGARPTAPYGPMKLTAEGIVKEGHHVDCRSTLNQFVSACTDAIGKRTRPDCTQENMKPFCNYAIQGCAAAKDFQVDLGPQFNDCSKGLSLLQFEELSVMICGATRRLQSEKISMTKDAKLPGIVTACDEFREIWRQQRNLEMLTLKKAIQGVQENRECFADLRR